MPPKKAAPPEPKPDPDPKSGLKSGKVFNATTRIFLDNPPTICIDIIIKHDRVCFPFTSSAEFKRGNNVLKLDCAFDVQLEATIVVRGGPVMVAMLVNNVLHATHPAIGEYSPKPSAAKSLLELEPRAFTFSKGFLQINNKAWEASLRTTGISPSPVPNHGEVITGKLGFRFWKAPLGFCNDFEPGKRLQCWHCGDNGSNQDASYDASSTTLDISLPRLKEVSSVTLDKAPGLFICSRFLGEGYETATFMFKNYSNSKDEPIVLDDPKEPLGHDGKNKGRELDSRNPPESASKVRKLR